MQGRKEDRGGKWGRVYVQHIGTMPQASSALAQVEEPVIPALNSELRAFTVTQAVEAPRAWGVGVWGRASLHDLQQYPE